jgi:hypothetical protein
MAKLRYAAIPSLDPDASDGIQRDDVINAC